MADKFDVVGFGLNATDRIITVERMPGPGGKVQFYSQHVCAGGQVAVACSVCRRFGFSASYAGSVGDDEAGRFQIGDLTIEGIDLSHLRVVPATNSQTAFIFVDCTNGERTIVYERPAALAFPPDEVEQQWVTGGRVLHLDGHDGAAAARAAGYARRAGVTVVADLNNLYEQQRDATEQMLGCVDYLVSSQSFPARLTGIAQPRQALAAIRERYGIGVVAMTAGAAGVLALTDEGFIYEPGYEVNVRDTTGAGDVFHGGFLVGLLRNWPLARSLQFANALAALNCTAVGAKGRIANESEVRHLQATAPRISRPEFL